MYTLCRYMYRERECVCVCMYVYRKRCSCSVDKAMRTFPNRCLAEADLRASWKGRGSVSSARNSSLPCRKVQSAIMLCDWCNP